jgi:uncharacterized ferritin-like protein (DUF455 family)
LQLIYEQEIGHVAIGRRWFDFCCCAQGLIPAQVFHDRVARFFNGELKPPFNRAARDAAGLPACYYEPLATSAMGRED